MGTMEHIVASTANSWWYTYTRLLVTMFASVPREPDERAPDELVSKRPRTESQSKTESSLNQPESPSPNADGVLPESHRLSHGPLFRALPDKLQAMIQKIHKNLGHPGHAQMKAALQSEGWSETVIQALQDFQYDICHEQQAPKIARPAHLTTPINSMTWVLLMRLNGSHLKVCNLGFIISSTQQPIFTLLRHSIRELQKA